MNRAMGASRYVPKGALAEDKRAYKDAFDGEWAVTMRTFPAPRWTAERSDGTTVHGVGLTHLLVDVDDRAMQDKLDEDYREAQRMLERVAREDVRWRE